MDAEFKKVQAAASNLSIAQPQKTETPLRGETANPLYAVPVFLYAAAVWDVAGLVNYVGAVNVSFVGNVAVLVYAKVAFWPQSSSPNSQLESENTIAEFSAALAKN